MGYAYLPDGTRIDYKEYIEKHPHWQKVRQTRFDFDNHQCAVCHCNLDGQRYETHHMSYLHLGNERVVDVITLCPKHHTVFHNNWSKQKFWKGKESGHWDAFSLEGTAELCATYYIEDKFISKNPDAPNLCNLDTCRQYVDQYAKDFSLVRVPVIDINDISLFVRNKRYELLFEAEQRGLSVNEFLDECYGLEVRGKNPIRRDAKAFFNKHSIENMHLHYSENPNINKLMNLVEEKENNHE